MSEHQPAEAGLRDHAEKERRPPAMAEAIVSTLREPLLVLDGNFEVVSANRAFYRTFQTGPEETIGQSLFTLGNGEWDLPALRELLDHVLPEHSEFSDFEVELTFEHIGRRQMLLNARQLAPIDGMQALILLAIEDVTGRATWQETEARLRARVAEKTEALEKAYAALEQRNQELQNFAYVTSHDLQEPLRKISAFANLLQDEFSDRLGDAGRHYLERVHDAAGRMATLIDDLLTFSRLTTEAPRHEPVALSDIVARVLEDLELRLQESGAEIVVGELPEIEADPMQMRQLFQNLLSNALKYQPEGNIPRIHIRAEELRKDGATTWRIRVQDNGIGFDEKYLDRIFAPFQRLHHRGEYSGTGIGLAICQRIAERHGGTITAESAPGEGATFIVDLPG